MIRKSSEQGWSSCLGLIPIAVPISSGVAVVVPTHDRVYIVINTVKNEGYFNYHLWVATV